MIRTEKDEDFVSLLIQFKKSIDKLFDEVVDYDYELADEKIIVENKKKLKRKRISASSPGVVSEDKKESWT